MKHKMAMQESGGKATCRRHCAYSVSSQKDTSQKSDSWTFGKLEYEFGQWGAGNGIPDPTNNIFKRVNRRPRIQQYASSFCWASKDPRHVWDVWCPTRHIDTVLLTDLAFFFLLPKEHPLEFPYVWLRGQHIYSKFVYRFCILVHSHVCLHLTRITHL